MLRKFLRYSSTPHSINLYFENTNIINFSTQFLTFNRYGIDSKYLDVAETRLVSVIKPCDKLNKEIKICHNEIF